jgi:hypothetical protein
MCALGALASALVYALAPVSYASTRSTAMLAHQNQQNQQLNIRDQYSLIGLEETDQTHRSYLDLT